MFRKIIVGIDKVISFFEEWTLFVAVMAALLALFVNVVLRYGFNYTLAWSEELVREVIIFTTFIGCSAAIKNKSIIKIDAVIQIFPKFKNLLIYFSNFILIIFSFMLIYYGWKMAELQVITSQKTIILRIPLVYLYSILPITGVMMVFRTAYIMWQDFEEQF
ncbi:MAG: C4-dicarboxylate ABC transporter substrate-binding protein [Desulfobacteraceae bacterium 4572_130]|nr:MAG: C4-dicarboxylate ABC transporter substrate-binding protein [Desulfobacteraceae bacterium 4572_130]